MNTLFLSYLSPHSTHHMLFEEKMTVMAKYYITHSSRHTQINLINIRNFAFSKPSSVAAHSLE